MHGKKVLFVDDEPHILSSLKRLLRGEDYQILTATSGEEGLKVLQTNSVQLVISDQRMPNMEGTVFLQKVKELYPHTVRVILSGFADASVIVESINKGEIYRFIGKPWNDEELKSSIRQSFEHYEILQHTRELEEQTRLQNVRLSKMNEYLENMVEQRTESLKLSQEILENLPVGVVGISREMEVVFANIEAGNILQILKRIIPGTEAVEVFPENLVVAVDFCVKHATNKKDFDFRWDGKKVDCVIVPLGENAERGAIVTLRGEEDA
jgi:two-component system NtrC family sensor kinase